MKRFILSCLLISVSIFSEGQFYIEPFAGFRYDLNNSNPHYKQINTGFHFCFNGKRSYEPVIQFQYSWPIAYKSGDSAFSLNPALPLSINVPKKIAPYSFSFSFINRFVIVGKGKTNSVYLTLNLGATYQLMKVTYRYNKNNYTILNPDKTLKLWGPNFGIGALYMHAVKNGRLFVQADVTTPTLGAKEAYPSSFKFLSPMSINFGYSFMIKNKKR